METENIPTTDFPATTENSAATETTSTTENSTTKDSAKPPEQTENEEDSNTNFECNICLDSAKDAVVSLCGHLFCWPCLLQWMQTRPHRKICPVCKAGIDRDKVVPLYGRGSTDQKDPRDKELPPRPRGQRPEPENSTFGASGFFGPFQNNGAGGFHMSFGIGAFPFGFFATNMNLGGHIPPAPAPGTNQYEEEQVLNRVFVWMALALIFFLFYT